MLFKKNFLFFLFTLFTLPYLAADSDLKQPISDFQKEIEETINNATSAIECFDRNVLDIIYEKAPKALKDSVDILKIAHETSDYNKARNGNLEMLSNRLLLVGPPGVGKTSLAMAVVAKLGWKYCFIRAPMLGNEYKNSESANLARLIGSILSKKEPIVIIIDEINIFADPKETPYGKDINASAVLWLLLDKCAGHSNILIIGTANDATKLPPQLKDRFEGNVIEIPLGNSTDRYAILEYYLAKRGGCDCTSKYLRNLAKKMDNFSYRKIETLVNTAYQQHLLYNPFSERITQANLEDAYKRLTLSSQILRSQSSFSLKNWVKENSVFIHTISSSVNLLLLFTSFIYVAVHGKKSLNFIQQT